MKTLIEILAGYGVVNTGVLVYLLLQVRGLHRCVGTLEKRNASDCCKAHK